MSCGGGGGGGGGGTLVANEQIGVFTGFTGDLDWELPGGGGGGDGSGSGPGDGGDGGGGAGAGGDAGQFRRALVIVKFPDGRVLGQAPTDDSGMVTIRPGRTYGGPLLIELHGQPDAVYFDEGKNTLIPFPPGQILRTYVPTVRSNIGITPFSDAVYRLLSEGDTPDRVSGFPSAAQIEAANRKVRDIINQQFPASLQIADITRLPVIKSDTTTADSLGTDPRGAYGLINGAFSKQAAMFNPADPAPTITAAQHLGEDLLDGHLDGMRSGRPIAPADKRTYDPHTIAGELSSALAEQSYRYGKSTAIDSMPAITNFGNTRYETYLFDARLTPSGKANVTVAGWDGANDKNRQLGDSAPLLPATARIQSILGNLGHGGLFLKADSENSVSKVYAVGDNTNGELGNGTREATTAAVEVILPGTLTHIAGGFGHTVARLADGSVYAWGDNSYGQLGQGIASPQLVRSTIPMRVTLPRGALAVAASNVASYALLDDGSVYSWGSAWGLGLLGDGTRDSIRLTPGPVLAATGPLSGVVQIAARDNDAVVLRADGSVMTWGSFPADTGGGLTGGRQVATRVDGLPDPSTARIRKVLTEQGLFVAQTTTGAVFHWGVHFDLTAQAILRDITAVQVLNLPPVRDIMPGGFLGYGERPFDRVTAMGSDPNGGNWKIRGRVAEFYDPANPSAQRRPKGQSPRPDCSSCHGVLPSWPIKAPPPTSNAACVLPSFKLDSAGRPVLVNSRSDCTMCHNGSYLPFLNCVVPTLPAPPASTSPPVSTTPCQIPSTHVQTPSGTVCASCHNSVIARPLTCLPNTATDPNAPVTRAPITSVTDDVQPVTGPIPSGGSTNDATPTISGSLSAALAGGQSVQVLRNNAVAGTATVNGSAWSFTDSTRAQGTYSYNARVVQGASLGPLGSAHVVVIDTQPPTAGIVSAALLDDAGAVTGSLADGATTDDSTPSVQGTLNAPLGAGDSVRVLRNNIDVGTATVNGTSFGFANSALINGTYSFLIRVVDAAGNVGSSVTRTVTVNTSSTLDAAARATIVSASDDAGSVTGTFGSGGVTDDAQPTLNGTLGRTLNPANGEQVRVFRANSSGFGVAAVSGGSWSFTPTSALADGSYSFTAQVVDGQGRFGAISAPFVVVVDRQAPLAATGVSAVSNYPPITGAITSGSVSNDNSPTINISLSAPRAAGESFRITRSLGSGTPQTLSILPTEISATSFSFEDASISSAFVSAVATPAPALPPFTSPALPSSFNPVTVSYVVRLVDAAGNQGTAGTFSFTLDYPVCNRARVPASSSVYFSHNPANGSVPAASTCTSCHRAGNGYVQVPGTPNTPRYWCRY